MTRAPKIEADGFRRYGRWAGMPNGIREDVTRCIEEVHDGHLFHQCGRKRGHGPDGLYCKQHDPAEVARRKAEADAKSEAGWQKRRAEMYGHHFLATLRQIAAGHNDPRGLASEVVSRFDQR